MSVASPTLIPQRPKFPLLLPRPPQPHPVPLAPRSQRRRVRLSSRRDINRELEQLSEEENEIEEQFTNVRTRGFSFIIPIGKQMTLQEEKNDAPTESSDAGSDGSGDGSNGDDGENMESGVEQDLDASVEDMDAEQSEDVEEEEEEEGDESGPQDGDYSMNSQPTPTSSPR
ncbi:hypothetical protein EXIGLDRAFT_773715 [Exidia glandulosa HHB12029]|uniref:Uncharacterized protein n=1 Tax=Exidia glandulosa HHB12029 TaxID=1314781 RepID=A0A165EPC9_EXIGL|nr:hypothetical protein EXIGLDRAFT_773715 [Exidia glandulosa HHB12029]